uniref:RBR-type E3 ubiquitin transferase n=1 Tax=Rhizochromulina marina TaxID=1034831 RepID=A0A7S2R436_9STRA|mmetsp:Transcript_10303/g.29415  ORF Transcript_10303/g.29415 Transcript_10303/m.29415 type:complete len:630 (+) Transcript_10303:145-2034(+)|eukprot:CAMPEP_0118996488 /NCGR_PEP_ID=MMETSP1173-20130426/60178_1 /TAXON_ID=1034831 /ORGANISM="Rhizochromulina marina cf, Strain CCMP1243" /LENGTH=629 /DNA_ID=CAMNT_0006947883 /DNA_START=72 /DNA_END=1961 /DNA_ORIENTATION=+
MSDVEEDEEYEYEEGEEEEEYHYSDDEGTAPALARVDSVPSSRGGIQLMDEDGVGRVIRRHVAEVAEMLGLSEDAAQVLLNYERWSSSQALTEKWLLESDRVLVAAGLELPPEKEQLATHPADQPFTCPVCADEKPVDEGFALKCNHLVCHECWAQGLTVHVATTEGLRTTCFSSCSLVVPPSVFRRFLEPDTLSKYDRWTALKFIECSQNMQACPSPGCKAVAHGKFVQDDIYSEVACRCGSRWCFNCKADDHRPATCLQVKAWNDKGNSQDLTEMYIKANTKRCPKCHLEIIKDEGCAHMRCSQCDYHFCWLCLGPYSSHSEKTGGFYACNKFERRIKSQGRTEDEKRALRAKQQLRNYEMAFERHINHKNALEIAEQELHDQLEAKLKALADDGFEELHQLRIAVEQVIASRRVLAWSYVFKLYQFEDENSERELQLFETYQGKLEHMTEDLQSRLSEISTFASSTSGAAEDSFSSWRQGVVHLMGAVKSFAVNVVEFAADSDCYAGAGMEWQARERDAELENSQPRPIWSWRDDSNTWNPYSDENMRKIEEARVAGDQTLIITSSGRRYRLDLHRMTQTNLETNGSRTIRRKMESNSSWTCPRCSYHNTGDSVVCMMCETPRGNM